MWVMVVSEAAASLYAGTGPSSPDVPLPVWAGAAALASQPPAEMWVMKKNNMVVPCHKMVGLWVDSSRAFQNSYTLGKLVGVFSI